MRGYFEIGVWHPKTEHNIGTLWRSAYQLGAAGIFTVGPRYERQASDVPKTWRHLPLRNYSDLDDLIAALPFSCPLVAIEMGGEKERARWHSERCCYLLGAEDHGLPRAVLERCHRTISLPCAPGRTPSFNVAVAGSIVMWDRFANRGNFVRDSHRLECSGVKP